MRLDSTVGLTVALTALACAGRPSPTTAPPPQSTAGSPTAFGTGIVFARPYQVRVLLTAPAYLTLVRVWPDSVAELVFPSANAKDPAQRGPGSWSLRVPPPGGRYVSATPLVATGRSL